MARGLVAPAILGMRWPAGPRFKRLVGLAHNVTHERPRRRCIEGCRRQWLVLRRIGDHIHVTKDYGFG